MRRIVVVGPPGSGKTTVAAEIARTAGLAHVELDALYWGPEWTPVPLDAFRARLADAVTADRWVTDGNYFSLVTQDITWPLADTVVWLDLPRHTTVARVIRRTATRAIARTEMWSGNRESLRTAVGRDSIIRFAWTEYPKYKRRYGTLMADPRWAHLRWVRLISVRAVRTWLDSLAALERGGNTA